MGNNNELEERRSKFTPTGNEQADAAVQPEADQRSKEHGADSCHQLEEEEQRASTQGAQPDDPQNNGDNERQGEERGIFSALVGDGKEP